MERKIGEVFEYEGKALRVEEYKDNVNECFGCFLDGKCFSSKAVGHCEAERRTDKKNVIFVEVKEETKEQQQEEQKLNLCEILKDCPRGTKLYSTVFGYVIFQGIVESEVYPIVVSCENGVTKTFTADGNMFIDYDGECTLFPSKEQRSWADFIAPWLKKERFDPKTLKAFDRVLVRDNHYQNWTCGFFSHIVIFDDTYRYNIAEVLYEMCIPYNDDTKHLVGTTDEAPEFYRYWEG